jgi:DNA-binding transcriptional LysR family regulator
MQIDQLIHLLTLEKEKNFGRASKAVHLTQPALTKSIKRLEEHFEVQIFDRLPKGVYPTSQGKLVIEWARSVLSMRKLLFRDLNYLAGLSRGTLTIGAGPYVADAVIGPFVGAFIKEHPKMEVKILNRPWYELEGMLLSHAADLYIGYVSELYFPDDIEILAKRTESIMWFCRVGHPLLSKKTVSRQDIVSFPFATLSFSAGNEKIFHAPGFAEGFERVLIDYFDLSIKSGGREHFPVSVQCDDLETLRKVVLTSDAISFLPDSAVLNELEERRFVRLPFSVPGLGGIMGIAALRRRTLSPSASAFVEIFREALEEWGGRTGDQ